MAPHVNKWPPVDGTHRSQVTAVIVTTSELSYGNSPIPI